jgi:ketosteroid isomerase-like protein
VSSTDETKAITAVLHAYAAALGSYNGTGPVTSSVNQTLSLYTTDGVIMPPHFPPSAGQDSLRDSYTRIFQTIKLTIEFDIDEIVIMSPGEWAFARTTAKGVKTMLASGAEEEHHNQELFIFRCEEGEWKIARYAFSTMKPLVQDGVRRS